MITSAAQGATPVALRQPFWNSTAMRFFAGLGILTLSLTVMALIYKVGTDMVIFEASLVAICIGGLVVGAIRHRNAPIPKSAFLGMVRQQLGTDELCYPFFRNCKLDDLRGEQGGWTTPDKFRMTGANLHSVGTKPVHLKDHPDPAAACVLLITRNDSVVIALAFGEQPEFSLPASHYGNVTVFYVGHMGAANFDPALFN